MSPLFLIFLTVFIDMVGFGIIIPVLPLYAEHFHATPAEIGWLTGIYSGMQVIFVPILGRLSDRFGRRPVLIVSLGRHGDRFSHHGMGLFARSPLRCAHHRWRDWRQHRHGAGLHRRRQHTGESFALDGRDWRGLRSRLHLWSDDRRHHEPHFVCGAFLFAAALATVNVVLLYFILPESLSAEYRSKPHERVRLAEVFQHGHGRLFGTIVATYFFAITGFAIMTTLFALFTEKHFGFDARQTGYVFGFIGIISVILQGGLIGRLVKVFGETALARTGLLLLTIALTLLPLVPTLPALLAICAVVAISNGLTTPTLNGLASQMVDRGWQGRALGVMQSAGSLGRLIGPLLGGWLLMFDLGKPLRLYARTPLFASGAILLIAFAFALTFHRPAQDKAQPATALERDV